MFFRTGLECASEQNTFQHVRGTDSDCSRNRPGMHPEHSGNRPGTFREQTLGLGLSARMYKAPGGFVQQHGVAGQVMMLLFLLPLVLALAAAELREQLRGTHCHGMVRTEFARHLGVNRRKELSRFSQLSLRLEHARQDRLQIK